MKKDREVIETLLLVFETYLIALVHEMKNSVATSQRFAQTNKARTDLLDTLEAVDADVFK